VDQPEVRTPFSCNGRAVVVTSTVDESLLVVLRERLGIVSVKDGCAPQGQCGCCTVLVDGEPRVACVTPISRVAGRAVTTVEGLDASTRDRIAAAFVTAGGSQCGFCTPGIVVRSCGGRVRDLDRALAAHLCRCTGWRTVYDAIRAADHGPVDTDATVRDLDAAARRAELEGGVGQTVRGDIPLGGAHFADDTAPRDAVVAVPLPPGSSADAVDAAGLRWVVGDTLAAARRAAAKVQGRRTTVEERPPLFDRLPSCPPDGVRLATSWVEPAYLEPDASWCAPGCQPASPYVNGGAFGAKLESAAPRAARELADRLQRVVRVVYSREDVVRLGPKRPPIAATARWSDGSVHIDGVFAAGGAAAFASPWPSPYAFAVSARWHELDLVGPPVSAQLRAAGLAEQAVLVEGALDVADIDRGALTDDPTLLDTCVRAPSGASAGAQVRVDPATGAFDRIAVRVAAGDPLDETVLRSYAIGAAHMALGWVCTESLTVDPATGMVHDLTIRSFGILRAKDMPAIEVDVIDDARAPLAGSSDAVFAAVAAATWNALTRAEGTRPDTFPTRQTRASRRLRR
jgi:aerobic-type carbon monoxide dehydrogenase small subunit (CoxS/CutS family)